MLHSGAFVPLIVHAVWAKARQASTEQLCVVYFAKPQDTVCLPGSFECVAAPLLFPVYITELHLPPQTCEAPHHHPPSASVATAVLHHVSFEALRHLPWVSPAETYTSPQPQHHHAHPFHDRFQKSSRPYVYWSLRSTWAMKWKGILDVHVERGWK